MIYPPWSTDSFNGMPYMSLGNCGLKVSRVGLGTWKFGLPETGDGARVDEPTAEKIFDRAHELGVTFWDTANRYNGGSGNSERLIGRWFARNPGLRRDIVLATKIAGGMDGWTPNHSGLSRSNIIDSVHASLERLQTDHIDLLYFHAVSESGIEESLTAVEDLICADKVRYFGVSNCSAQVLALYAKALRDCNLLRARVAAVQNRYNIVQKESPHEAGTLKYCLANGISYIAWSPFAEGLLTGRYLTREAAAGDRLFDEGLLQAFSSMLPRVADMCSLCKKWGVTVPRAVLAATLTVPGMGPVIPAVSNVAQLEEDASAVELVLSHEQTEQLLSL